MMLGVGLAALTAAQVGGAFALWPRRSVAVLPAEELPPFHEERVKELAAKASTLEDDLDVMRADRDRLAENEAAAIEKRDEYRDERDDLKVRCDDLLKECKRLRKAAIRSEVDGDDKKD